MVVDVTVGNALPNSARQDQVPRKKCRTQGGMENSGELGVENDHFLSALPYPTH